jgi:hypothetical protein
MELGSGSLGAVSCRLIWDKHRRRARVMCEKVRLLPWMNDGEWHGGTVCIVVSRKIQSLRYQNCIVNTDTILGSSLKAGVGEYIQFGFADDGFIFRDLSCKSVEIEPISKATVLAINAIT